MKNTIFTLFALCGAILLSGRVSAAWYWPFERDEDSTNTPVRLHRLLENANDLIEQAEDAALDGKGDDALKFYQSALTNLQDVAIKNPDRAETAEFAPLRNKIAATQAAMDSIRFAQVNENIRAVSVTDTRELEKKWEEEQLKKKGLKRKAEEKKQEAKKKAEKKEEKKEKKAEQTEKENPTVAAPKVEETALAPKRPQVQLEGMDEMLRKAVEELQAKDYAAADLLLEDLSHERPDDLNVLIMWAAAKSGLKMYLAARRTLEKAQRAHPKSYLPCYNLAHLMFKIEGEGKRSARQYYDLGRTLGGPRDRKLEEKLK